MDTDCFVLTFLSGNVFDEHMDLDNLHQTTATKNFQVKSNMSSEFNLWRSL